VKNKKVDEEIDQREEGGKGERKKQNQVTDKELKIREQEIKKRRINDYLLKKLGDNITEA
jgi:hypothetical protein